MGITTRPSGPYGSSEVRETSVVNLDELLVPESTAVVTMELQRAVVGDLAVLSDLRDASAEVGMVDHAAELCRAARVVGARVVHCIAVFRPERVGSAANCGLLVASAELMGDRMDDGQPGAELVPELDVAASDVVVPRRHGLTPFTGTDLDQTLRNLGVSTVVAVGCSLNVGVSGMVMSAVDLGYQVVIPDDAVVGVPVDYGKAVLTNGLSLLATVVGSRDIIARWEPAG
jgi:nicotinamidase-related amidase